MKHEQEAKDQRGKTKNCCFQYRAPHHEHHDNRLERQNRGGYEDCASASYRICLVCIVDGKATQRDSRHREADHTTHDVILPRHMMQVIFRTCRAVRLCR